MMKSDPALTPFSYSELDAIEGYDDALECTLAFRGDAIERIDKVLAEHPQFVMGWLFRAAWLTQAMEDRVYPEMVNSVERARALMTKMPINDREQGYLNAMECWLKGDFFGAVQHWETVLTYCPFDLYALGLVHYTNVLLGDVTGQRDVVARVIDLWDESMPGYEYVLAFYAFGLEENRDFSKAEELARHALSLRPDHPYAVHVVCHVMEMRGRQSGGVRFMLDQVKRWGSSNFANHLWWHTALFYVDLEQIDSALDIYDQQLVEVGKANEKYEELDAAALLWRLTLLGTDVGQRWAYLADRWEPAARDTLYAFNDVHAMMTFVADNRSEAQQELLTENERYVENASDANVAMSREIGM
ncbi:MAG: tetratricopeptide repeat protein, partial [Gammaproteobacteria bacterium]|nr:tetratricopeptide repeat protein [Gammaproteobacteria bacterium]